MQTAKNLFIVSYSHQNRDRMSATIGKLLAQQWNREAADAAGEGYTTIRVSSNLGSEIVRAAVKELRSSGFRCCPGGLSDGGVRHYAISWGL